MFIYFVTLQSLMKMNPSSPNNNLFCFPNKKLRISIFVQCMLNGIHISCNIIICLKRLIAKALSRTPIHGIKFCKLEKQNHWTITFR